LVEKPIAISSSEAKALNNEAEKHPKLKTSEVLMYKHHPQWLRVKEMISNGAIRQLKTIQSFKTLYRYLVAQTRWQLRRLKDMRAFS